MAVQIMLEVGADRRASLHSYLHALKGIRKIGGVESVQVIVWKDVSYSLECIPAKEGQVSAGERPFLTGLCIYTSTRRPLFPKGWQAGRCLTVSHRQGGGFYEPNVRRRYKAQLALAHQCRNPWEHVVCINLERRQIAGCMKLALDFALRCDARMRSAHMRNGHWIRLEEDVEYTSRILDFSVLNQLVCPIFFCPRPTNFKKRAFLCVWRADIAIHRVYAGAALYRKLGNQNVRRCILSCLFPLEKLVRSPCHCMALYAAENLLLLSGLTIEMRVR